ncbi:MAG: TonB-dependent receptor [Cytophagales bacterium]|nr:TonB-dependent receptor [Bernardetiaceae bacterium]MDW8211555.1 TonB-dependent receptor [Cytophagales bacterium]
MKNILTTIALLFFIAHLYGQELKGKVTNPNGEPLPGVYVSVLEANKHTVTNAEGLYSLSLRAGTYRVRFSSVGYEVKIQEVTVPAEGIALDVTMEENITQLAELEVVGTRNLNRSIVETPAPIDVIDISTITAKTGQLDLNQLLQFVAPSFNSNRQTGSDGTDHVDPASLRGLGPDQTLVLINGKRRHQSSLVNIYGTRGRGNTGTDLNAIPIAAIERIEILRDGAAAQYGSDAIAGVINIVLKQSVNELTLNANAGMHQAKYRFDDKNFDGQNYNLNANYGFTLAKKGFVNLTGDFNFRDHTNRANTHPDDLARREFGDPRIRNASLYFNARLPVSTKSYLYAFGGTNFRKGSAYAWTRFPDSERNIPAIYPNGFDPIIGSDITDHGYTAGFRTLAKSWDVDLYATYGHNRFLYSVRNTLNRSMGMSTPRQFDAGGFGLGQFNSGIKFNRFFKNAFRGLNLAFGSEFRLEHYNIVAGQRESWDNYDPRFPGGSQGFPGFRPADEIRASRNNIGAFIDAEADISRSFMVGAAVRFENYSDFGSTLNGKLALRFAFTDKIALRSTVSTGFRAPSLPQIYFNSTVTNFINAQPVEVLIARNNSPVTRALGIPPLKQETSLNGSLGLTITPLDNLTLTIDGYYAKIDNRVVLTGQFSDQDPDIGQELRRLRVGKAQFFTNAIATTTQGLDIVVVHNASIGKGKLTSTLAANFNRLTIDQVKTSPRLAGKEDIYFDLRERYFAIAAAPQSKINLTLDYAVGKWSALLRLVRFGEVILANWNYDENDLDIYSPKITTDIGVRYAFSKQIALALGVNNIFNVYPDQSAPSLTESGGAWDPVQMGSNGAFYYARLRVQLPNRQK